MKHMNTDIYSIVEMLTGALQQKNKDLFCLENKILALEQGKKGMGIISQLTPARQYRRYI